MIPEVLKCSFDLQALAYKNKSSLHHSKSQTNQVALASNSCHWLSLNFALFISSHMNFENVVCQLHQHYRFPNLFVVGPAYEILDKNPFIHSVFLASQLIHTWLQSLLHNSTFSFISFGVLCSPVDPNFLFSHRQVMWGMQPVPKTTRNPHQVRGLVLQRPRGHPALGCEWPSPPPRRGSSGKEGQTSGSPTAVPGVSRGPQPSSRTPAPGVPQQRLQSEAQRPSEQQVSADDMGECVF